ncbi:MAG TPA: hypothetical protein VFM25_06505 [Verrucomicrobiae bacterium]|nr:hypothetical protein [Verrucomicrobiae bacterium]
MHKNFRARLWFPGLAVALLAAPRVHAQYESDWTRNFRVGILTGFNIKADFHTGQNFNLGGNKLGDPTQPGGNHVFDDGYVKLDQTGNAGGLTANWGYDSADQVSGSSLLMHSTTSFSTTSRSGTGDDTPYVGFDMAYGGVIHRWQQMRLGWELGFGLLPITISEHSSGPATINRRVFSYDTGGIIMPAAPYRHDANGTGPLIGDTATELDSETSDGTDNSKQTLDVMLFPIRLGPTLFWDVAPKVGLSLGAGPALGIVTGSYKFDDALNVGGTVTHHKGEINQTDVVFGGYVNATVTYHAVANGDFYLSAEYMPMGSSTFSGGGRQAKLDLSGAVYVSAGINWPF